MKLENDKITIEKQFLVKASKVLLLAFSFLFIFNNMRPIDFNGYGYNTMFNFFLIIGMTICLSFISYFLLYYLTKFEISFLHVNIFVNLVLCLSKLWHLFAYTTDYNNLAYHMFALAILRNFISFYLANKIYTFAVNRTMCKN